MNLFVHSCYQSTGAYTHHDTDVNLDWVYSIASSSSTAAELANQNSKVLDLFFKRVKKPLWNRYWISVIVLILCIILYGSLVSQFAFKIIKQQYKTGSISTGNWTVLNTTEAGSRTLSLFDSYGTTFLVDNEANTYVCNNSRIFIGPRIDSNVTLDTTNGNLGLCLKTGPVYIAW